MVARVLSRKVRRYADLIETPLLRNIDQRCSAWRYIVRWSLPCLLPHLNRGRRSHAFRMGISRGYGLQVVGFVVKSGFVQSGPM